MAAFNFKLNSFLINGKQHTDLNIQSFMWYREDIPVNIVIVWIFSLYIEAVNSSISVAQCDIAHEERYFHEKF